MQTNQEETEQSPKSKSEERQRLSSEMQDIMKTLPVQPRWIFLGTITVIAIVLSILSERLTVGPPWLIPTFLALLLVPTFLTTVFGYHHLTRPLALSIMVIITVALITSVILMILALFRHSASATVLFRDAALLWLVNVVTFGLWYWEVDRGGPIMRHSKQPERADFVFPQGLADLEEWADWHPGFIDYLFLAFNSSTAFSPTDTLVMSRRAKLLMMLQSAISLIILAVLAARAVNIA